MQLFNSKGRGSDKFFKSSCSLKIADLITMFFLEIFKPGMVLMTATMEPFDDRLMEPPWDRANGAR
jgi:hypothetical protein